MKSLAIVFMAALLAACANLGIVDPGPEQRAARNRCEAMRSYRPYYPNECGELSGVVPYGVEAPYTR
jgi:hypothetical protein